MAGFLEQKRHIFALQQRLLVFYNAIHLLQKAFINVRDLRQAKLDLIKLVWDKEIGRLIKLCIEQKARNVRFKTLLNKLDKIEPAVRNRLFRLYL